MLDMNAERARFLSEILSLETELRAYVRRLCSRDSEEINDCVNETYLRVLGIEDWYRFSSRAALLKRVARNLFFDQFQRKKLFKSYLQRECHGQRSLQGVSPEDLVVEQRNIDQLLQQMEALPPQQRQALILRSWEGMSYRQISRKMGVAVSTIEKHVSRARTHLRDEGTEL